MNSYSNFQIVHGQSPSPSDFIGYEYEEKNDDDHRYYFTQYFILGHPLMIMDFPESRMTTFLSE